MFAFILAAAAVVSGCSSGPGGGRSASDEAKVRAANTSQFQAEILADGVVTYSEYERSVLASMDCIRASDPAVEMRGPEKKGKQLTYQFGIKAATEAEGLEASRRLEAASTDCGREFESDVQVVYNAQRIMSADEREKLRPAIVQCLNEQGIQLSPKASDKEIGEATSKDDSRRAAEGCFDKYSDYFIAPPR